MILGIDEAGRGPCIGPLVMCGCLIDEKKIDELRNLKIKDSKQLTKQKREELNKILKKKEIIIDYKTIKVYPYLIDRELNNKNSNLNYLEAKTTAKIITFLLKKHKAKLKDIKKIIIDCPTANTKSYHNLIQDLTNTKNKIITEHKADEKYISVSAASILAKVMRDHEIDKLQKRYKKTIYGNIGSGYPSDVSTIEFIKKYWATLSTDKKLFRKTWKTYKRHVSLKNQKKIFDY